MSRCCGSNEKNLTVASVDPASPPGVAYDGPAGLQGSAPCTNDTLAWFGDMVQHCYDYAVAQKEKGAGIVGIMCEYTPREIIMAAGALPVCLCGGSEKMIAPAEEELPANLCPLIKSTYGYSLKKANPFLEMADLVVAETTCDGKKKMYELLAERHPLHVLELPQKSGDTDARDHWVSQVRRFSREMEQRFGVTITKEKLRTAIAAMNRERKLRRDLAALMKSAAPPLAGRELLDLKSLISCIPADLAQYKRALTGLPARSTGRPADGRTRVLLTGVPLPHGAERVLDIIEQGGGLVVCQENCTGLKPILDDIDETAADPLEAIADNYFHLPCSVMTLNDARLDLLRRLAGEYRPGCVIELVWQACITYDVESVRVKRLVETELGLPYLRIQTDYSPSDSARIALRVEALFETVSARRGTGA